MYARISPQTIVSWERRRNSALPVLNDRSGNSGLSFLQLIEIAVVAAMRNEGMKLSEIRSAREYICEKTNLKYPFAQLKFKADGVDIFLEYDGGDADTVKEKLLSANRRGQLVWSLALSNRLREFGYGSSGEVESWRVNGIDSPIEISPRVSFGAPSINGVATVAIKRRWADGYSIGDIADDLSLEPMHVEEALKFERLEIDRGRASHWVN